MSDEEYERFEISNYDLENEFNINRPQKKYSKNQQIYGIWADDSEADSEEEYKGRRKVGKKIRTKDYSAPVRFVTGGVQQSGKKDESAEEIDDCQITDEEDDHRPSFGKKKITQKYSSESEDERPSMSASKQPHSIFAPTSASISASNNKKLGAWQQHTRGIGAKLLLQMGYEPGKGLGKELQGISQPVEAHLRKGRGAIGAYGPEKPATIGGQKKKDKSIESSSKSESNESSKGKRDKKGKHNYRSVEEIIERGKVSAAYTDKLSKKLGNVPVIDMTGPEKRVLSGYHSLGQTKAVEEDLYDPKCLVAGPTVAKDNFTLPELIHNLNLIVNMCEQDIISIDRTEREACESQKKLLGDKDNLEKIVQLEQDHIGTLEQAAKLVEELTSPNVPLERAEQIFVKLQKDFPNEYKEFGLADLTAGVVAPLLKNQLEYWRPFEEPRKYVETVRKWRTILEINQIETKNIFDPYSSLIWAGIIPTFRQASNDWNPKIHQYMATLLDIWAPLFPSWILDNVLEQLILPRLVSAVQDWDPLTDTIPIHIWILPWSSILSSKMEEHIYPTIREKLGNALLTWLPNDRSARAMLTPWKNAFDDGQMQAFLIKHIIPKLQLVLNELIVNPLQQDMELWNQVWEWNELISTLLMAQLLDKFFFPKWMQTLVIWLNQSPDFEQITRWYTGWKSQISEPLLLQPAIKEHFRRALEIMHRATEQGPIIPQPAPAPSSTNIIHPPALMDLQISPPPPMEFKELVLQRCSDKGILFAPMPGRREFGKQVYRCGKLFCYLDRNVLMVSDGNLVNWTPTSLGVMLERAS